MRRPIRVSPKRLLVSWVGILGILTLFSIALFFVWILFIRPEILELATLPRYQGAYQIESLDRVDHLFNASFKVDATSGEVFRFYDGILANRNWAFVRQVDNVGNSFRKYVWLDHGGSDATSIFLTVWVYGSGKGTKVELSAARWPDPNRLPLCPGAYGIVRPDAQVGFLVFTTMDQAPQIVAYYKSVFKEEHGWHADDPWQAPDGSETIIEFRFCYGGAEAMYCNSVTVSCQREAGGQTQVRVRGRGIDLLPPKAIP